MNYWLIFLTGLTTGGLTCLALQGGLLATAIATQRKNQDNSWKSTLLPTAFFLLAKITAYTVVGFLLGWLGSFFQISITTQIVIQFAVGIFMIISALRMLDIHPIFRRFVLTPPKTIFKFASNEAKTGKYFSPIILGLATVFLPCATTQTMEIQALGSGNPLSGALTMFMFTLGTSPLFFIIGGIATKFSQTMDKYIYPVAAALILFLGITAIDNGLTLLGSGFTFKGTVTDIWKTATQAPQNNVLASSTVTGKIQSIQINVLNAGYEPYNLSLRSGIPTNVKLVTNKTQGCSRAIVFPTLNIQKILPETGETIVELPALARGKIPFSCSMGMFSGTIEVI